MLIGLKVGSSLLTDGYDGKLNRRIILSLCQQIAQLFDFYGHQVFLVTSGAVASDSNKNRPKNLRAAVGMGRLIRHYTEYLEIFGLEAAQMLLTDHDLNLECRESLINLIRQALTNRIVPIINANDTVDWEELNRLEACADNDYLFCQLCLALRPDLAIIGFDQPGILSEGEQWVGKRRVSVVTENNFSQLLEFIEDGNEAGHGKFGMLTKIQIARHLARNNIKTIIAPGQDEQFVIKAFWELLKPVGDFGTIFQFDQLELMPLESIFRIKTMDELMTETGTD